MPSLPAPPRSHSRVGQGFWGIWGFDPLPLQVCMHATAGKGVCCVTESLTCPSLTVPGLDDWTHTSSPIWHLRPHHHLSSSLRALWCRCCSRSAASACRISAAAAGWMWKLQLPAKHESYLTLNPESHRVSAEPSVHDVRGGVTHHRIMVSAVSPDRAPSPRTVCSPYFRPWRRTRRRETWRTSTGSQRSSMFDSVTLFDCI